MELQVPYVLLTLVTVLVSLLTAAYLYCTHLYKYFETRGIPFERPSFPLGNLGPVFSLKKPYFQLLADMYTKYKGEKLIGFYQFWQKSVLIIDRELIKNVLVKDFEYFDEKNVHHNKDLEPLSSNVFAVDGEDWKILRSKMSPVFTSGKLKDMSNTMLDVAKELIQYLNKLTNENDVIECKDMLMRYGLAVIASTAFGLDIDVLNDKSSMFFKMSEKLTSPTLGAMCRNGLMFYGKEIVKMFNLRTIPKDAHDFFLNLVKDVVDYRETNGVTRNDFLQLLIQLKQGVKAGDQDFSITMNELAAQSYLFILAGFESSSNTMGFFLYEMALNPECQRKVQEEVDGVNDMSYDSLATMKYLDMAVDETLRKHAPFAFVGRACSRDYKVPETEHVIEKGTHVLVPAHGLHWDPDLFPEPERFIPERFSKENKDNIKPFSYMPFGDGPRFCLDFSITMNELAAQSYVFILAGFETSSNVMSFFLYEMAVNPDCQRKVHEELDAVKDITYDSLVSMEYLDMAVDETLRKHAPLAFVGRGCSHDYKVPGTEHVIEKGTHVLVAAHGLHWDPELFPEPERFIPERFSKENKNNIKPFSYMPFGEGPRFCIGMRFGKIQVKVGLALLMRDFEVQTTAKTPIPVKYEPRTINTTCQGGIWLRFVRRNQEMSS